MPTPAPTIVCPISLAAGQDGFASSSAPVTPRGGFDVGLGAERDTRQVPRQTRGEGRGEARDLLFAVFADDPQVERAVGAAAVVLRCRRSPAV